jgi:hypothetical protein
MWMEGNCTRTIHAPTSADRRIRTRIQSMKRLLRGRLHRRRRRPCEGMRERRCSVVGQRREENRGGRSRRGMWKVWTVGCRAMYKRRDRARGRMIRASSMPRLIVAVGRHVSETWCLAETVQSINVGISGLLSYRNSSVAHRIHVTLPCPIIDRRRGEAPRCNVAKLGHTSFRSFRSRSILIATLYRVSASLLSVFESIGITSGPYRTFRSSSSFSHITSSQP